MKTVARIAFVFLFLLAANTTLLGQEFRILNLTESLGSWFSSGISLNNQNVIAILVEVGSTCEVVTVDINGNFTNLTQGGFNFPGQASINDLAQTVFTADVEPPGDCTVANCNVVFWNGISFQNITNGTIPVEPAGVLGRALNDSGQVAIGTKEGLVLHNGANLIMLTAGTSITGTGNVPPSINSNGQIAFVGIDLTINRNDVYLFDGSAIINLTIKPALQVGGAGAGPSINDSGHIAFGGEVIGVPGGHLFFYDGTRTIDLTVTLGLPDEVSILGVSLNNNDQVAFITASPFGTGPSDLWFLDLNTGEFKQIDSGLDLLGTVQVNDHSNIAYIKGQNVMLATLIPSVVHVTIDIRPESDANRINPKSRGNINVAIFSVNGFDATSVDPSTVRFGATGIEATPIHVQQRDVDGDGRRDMVVQFKIQETGIECGDTSASLTGQTSNGVSIIGTGPVITAPCKK